MTAFATKCVQAYFGHHEEGANLPSLNFSVIYDLNVQQLECYRRYGSSNARSLAKAMRSLYDRPDDFPVSITNTGLAAYCMLCLIFSNARRICAYDMDDECLQGVKSMPGQTLQIDLNKAEDFTFHAGDLVFAEPISNPMLHPYDVKKICDLAHRAGAKVCVDNSLLSVVNYNPFDDGADIVLESGTKWLCGNGDAMLGIIIGADTKGRIFQTHGFTPSPIDCYLVQKGIPTMPLRMKRIKETGAKVYEYVKSITPYVSYDPRIGMVTFCVGDVAFQKELCKRCKVMFWGAVFGQSNTVIHSSNFGRVAYLPPPYNWCTRISCGLEDPDDLVADLKQAFEGAVASGVGRMIKGVKK